MQGAVWSGGCPGAQAGLRIVSVHTARWPGGMSAGRWHLCAQQTLCVSIYILVYTPGKDGWLGLHLLGLARCTHPPSRAAFMCNVARSNDFPPEILDVSVFIYENLKKKC